MKKAASLLAVISLLSGCGGGGGGGVAGPHAPVISNLSFSPDVMIAGAGGGFGEVSGTFDFSDSGGDLALIRVSAYDNNGTLLWNVDEPIQDAAGSTSGTIEGILSFATTDPGVFTFRTQVVDAAGSTSNALEGTFKVVNPDALAVGTPMGDSLAGGDSKYYAADVVPGVRYTVGVTGLSGPANLAVFDNDSTLRVPAPCVTNAPGSSLPRDCSLIATGNRLYIEVDGEPSTVPVSYTILAAPTPVITNPVAEGSRQLPVGIPQGVPTQGQVSTRAESFYITTDLTPGQPCTVSILGISADVDLHVYSDGTYSFELDCTLRGGGDVTNYPEECTTATNGTLYFSVRSGELNRDGSGYLILVE